MVKVQAARLCNLSTPWDRLLGAVPKSRPAGTILNHRQSLFVILLRPEFGTNMVRLMLRRSNKISRSIITLNSSFLTFPTLEKGLDARSTLHPAMVPPGPTQARSCYLSRAQPYYAQSRYFRHSTIEPTTTAVKSPIIELPI